MRDLEKEAAFVAGYQFLLAVGRTHRVAAGSTAAAAAEQGEGEEEESTLGPTCLLPGEGGAEEVEAAV